MPDERLHPGARSFSTAASVYERARPPFPVAAVDWLCAQLAITADTRVLDLAAGTGRLTRPLYARTRRIVAVEPVAEMREQLQHALPAIEVLDGIAEELPLATGCVDVVVVAQAFHWFDPEPALSEISRVLVPGGRLGIVWHAADLSDPVQQRFRALVERHRGGASAHVTGEAARFLGVQRLFDLIAKAEIVDVHEYDADGLAALALSTSHVARLSPELQAGTLGEARAIAADGVVGLPYVVELLAFGQAATTSH
ncbi:MAG: class I SAM-dependent methyltransferase [Gaiellales bacterium]